MFVKYTLIILIILTGNDDDEIYRLKKHFALEIEIKDLCPLCYTLGMEIIRSKIRISVSQIKYVFHLLEEMDMSGCKPSDTTMDPNQKLGFLIQLIKVDINVL